MDRPLTNKQLQNRIDELEAELEGDEKKKIIQCDAKSMEENKLSNSSSKRLFLVNDKVSII